MTIRMIVTPKFTIKTLFLCILLFNLYLGFLVHKQYINGRSSIILRTQDGYKVNTGPVIRNQILFVVVYKYTLPTDIHWLTGLPQRTDEGFIALKTFHCVAEENGDVQDKWEAACTWRDSERCKQMVNKARAMLRKSRAVNHELTEEDMFSLLPETVFDN